MHAMIDHEVEVILAIYNYVRTCRVDTCASLQLATNYSI